MLSDVQRQMLEAGTFHIDGWMSQRGREAAAHLESLGYLKSFVTFESQYTAVNYTVTDAGKAALSSGGGGLEK